MELHKIISDADSLTDPTCMDRLLCYLEELEEEAEEFMQMLLKNIDDMTVWWKQPWYQQSNLLTRPLQEPASDDEELYRTDSICKEETEKIEKNWQKFRKRYGLPDKLICFARWKNKDKSRKPSTPMERARKFVTAYLARGLQRNLYQVYKHIITWYGAPVKGSYSNLEERIMEICFFRAPKKAVVYLSAVLGREPRGIYKKLCEAYVGKRERKRLRWTIPIVAKFLKLLIKYSGFQLNHLKNKTFEKSMWVKLEEEMDQYYYNLKSFCLRTYPYLVWTDIRWKEIVKHFPDGFTPGFLYRTIIMCVKQYPKYRVCPLEDVIHFGLEKIKASKSNKRLRTLGFDEQGNLQVVKYDAKF